MVTASGVYLASLGLVNGGEKVLQTGNGFGPPAQLLYMAPMGTFKFEEDSHVATCATGQAVPLRYKVKLLMF
jgi:hypothetical protein